MIFNVPKKHCLGSTRRYHIKNDCLIIGLVHNFYCCLVFGGRPGPTLNEIILILLLKPRFRNCKIDGGPKRPGPKGPQPINFALRNLDFNNKINIISFNVGPGRPPKTKLRIEMQNQPTGYLLRARSKFKF